MRALDVHAEGASGGGMQRDWEGGKILLDKVLFARLASASIPESNRILEPYLPPL